MIFKSLAILTLSIAVQSAPFGYNSASNDQSSVVSGYSLPYASQGGGYTPMDGIASSIKTTLSDTKTSSIAQGKDNISPDTTASSASKEDEVVEDEKEPGSDVTPASQNETLLTPATDSGSASTSDEPVQTDSEDEDCEDEETTSVEEDCEEEDTTEEDCDEGETVDDEDCEEETTTDDEDCEEEETTTDEEDCEEEETTTDDEDCEDEETTTDEEDCEEEETPTKNEDELPKIPTTPTDIPPTRATDLPPATSTPVITTPTVVQDNKTQILNNSAFHSRTVSPVMTVMAIVSGFILFG